MAVNGMFQQMHHIAIIGTNYEASLRFYRDILGMEVLRDTARPEQNDHKLDLRFGTAELELFIKPGSPPRPSYPEACGLRHLAFHTNNIEKSAAYLNNHGVKIEQIRIDDITGEKMTFFFDPDGLPLELHE